MAFGCKSDLGSLADILDICTNVHNFIIRIFCEVKQVENNILIHGFMDFTDYST